MILYEKERSGANNALTIFENQNFEYPLPHFHRNYEFIYIYAGELSVLLDEETITLKQGEFLLVFPNQIHAYYSIKTAHVKVAIFSPNFINLFYQQYSSSLPEKLITKLDDSISSFIIDNLKEESNEFLIKACLYIICSEILKQTKLVPVDEKANFSLMHRLLIYIEENYKKNVTLRDASKAIGYNYQYLSKMINKQFAMSFSQMLNSYRVEYATHLLKSTDEKIVSIAYECGFENVRNFNRNFIKVTAKQPKAYRKHR